MTPTEARAAFKKAGHTQASLCRLLVELGDQRSERAIRGGLQKATASTHRDIPWYMAAILRLIKKMSESENSS
jgi:hypothetical protein